ncbi:MAG TPA: DUF1844 domain-containing protein [Desulfobacteraceae bacterium]|nr:DUF1844 domain-containing protein [Desulfobacteraceae bacterium]
MSEQPQNSKPCPEGRVRNEAGKCVMPEVTFTSLVLSLNTTALFHLGELTHPESGEKTVDLELVKHTIDTLSILRDKTTGNLDKDENQLLTNILYDLKMRFVQAKDSAARR